MRHRRGIWDPRLLGAVASAAVIAACAGGVSQSDYDLVKQQLAQQEQRTAGLQGQLSTFQQQATAKEREANEAQQKLAEKDKQLAEKDKLLQANGGFMPILGAKQQTPKPPAPAPTLAPGATPAPKPTPPPSLYESVGPFAFYVETLAAFHDDNPVALNADCVLANLFKRGSEIVWRFEAIDTATGKRLTDRDDPVVKVRLAHGEDLTARFSQRAGGRAPTAPWMWATAWDVPMNYPLGGMDYRIVVTTKDGRETAWAPPALTIPGGLDTRIVVVE